MLPTYVGKGRLQRDVYVKPTSLETQGISKDMSKEDIEEYEDKPISDTKEITSKLKMQTKLDRTTKAKLKKLEKDNKIRAIKNKGKVHGNTGRKITRVGKAATGPKKNKVGKLSRFTDEQFEAIIEEECGILSRVAKRLGLATTTRIYTRIKGIEGLKERIDNLYRAQAVQVAREGLMDHLLEGDKEMIRFALSNLDSDLGFKKDSLLEINVSVAAAQAVDKDTVCSFREMLLKHCPEAEERLEEVEVEWSELEKIDDNEGNNDVKKG